MTNTLPPLALADVRRAETIYQDRQVFLAWETWGTACDKIVDGYAPEAVATVLYGLQEHEMAMLLEWWADECHDGGPRDANCPDLLLVQAMNSLPGLDMTLPPIDADTVMPLLAERDALKAALCKLVYAAAHHNDALNTEDQPNGPQCPTGDDYNALLDMIEAAGAVGRNGEGGEIEGRPDPENCQHVWAFTGSNYGGDDDRWHGEGRCYCTKCGADGDA